MATILKIVGVKDGRICEMVEPSETAWFLIMLDWGGSIDGGASSRLRLTNGVDFFKFRRDKYFVSLAEAMLDIYQMHGIQLWLPDEEVGGANSALGGRRE